MDKQIIPVGYKLTEVGVIPEDWDWKPLGDICLKIQDGNYGESYPKSNEFVDLGIPFLTSKVLGKDGKIKEEKIDYISKEKHELLAKAHLELHDVLFTNRGASVGAIGFVDDRVSNGNIGPQLTLLRADNKYITSKYLFHIMSSSAVRRQILNQDSGSAMNFFGIGDTEKFKIIIPNELKEQTAIANALSDVDALIAALEKLIHKKTAIKTAAMQQLLTGKKRLPPFDQLNTGYKQTELGEIPKDWEVVELGSLSPFIGSGKTVTNGSGEYLLFGSTGIIGACKSPEYFGDAILVARVGANAGRLNFVTGEYGVSDNTIIVRIRSDLCISYFKYQLIKKNLNTLVFGSGQPLITGSQLKALLMPVPPLEEQTAIANVLSNMDTELNALQQRLAKTQQLKQGMMQELLTGKTRLVAV